MYAHLVALQLKLNEAVSSLRRSNDKALQNIMQIQKDNSKFQKDVTQNHDALQALITKYCLQTPLLIDENYNKITALIHFIHKNK